MQNLLIASCLAVAASAEAFYGYQLPTSGLATWPSTGNGYGASSTVYGAHGYRIGKRSADASYGYGIGYGIALPTTLENRNNVHGHELASGYAISQPHPGAAGSFQQRTQLHSGYGKRSADADASYGAVATLENRNNVHGHEYASQYAISQPHPGFGGSYQQVSRLHSGLHYGGYYGKRSAEPFYGGVAVHPGHAVSSTHRSVQGLSLGYGYGHGFYGYGKRSAEPFYGGVAVHPGHAVSSTHRSAQGLSLGYGYGHGYGYGKRSAEPFYGAAVTVENNNNLHGHELGSGYSISQPHPGHSGSSQHVSRIHSNIILPYSSGFGY